MIGTQRAALKYGGRGWPVFPVEPRGKRPLTSGGFKDATTKAHIISEWWGRWPDANIGMSPGAARFVVIDIDGPEGEATAERLGLLSEPTLEVGTGRGRHRWYHHPNAGPIGNAPLGDGLDVRADAGYVLLPPSVHPTGAIYKWAGKLTEVGTLPPPVVALLYENGKAASREPVPAEVRAGRRNAELTRVAGALRRLGLGEAAIAAGLRGVNWTCCRPPLGDDEVAAIARSLVRYEPQPADPFARCRVSRVAL